MAHRGPRESVEVLEKRFGYFPKVFQWRGTTYTVSQIIRCWTQMRTAPTLCFAVLCGTARFHLYQNVTNNSWTIREAA